MNGSTLMAMDIDDDVATGRRCVVRYSILSRSGASLAVLVCLLKVGRTTCSTSLTCRTRSLLGAGFFTCPSVGLQHAPQATEAGNDSTKFPKKLEGRSNPGRLNNTCNTGNIFNHRLHQNWKPRVLQRLTPKMARKFWSSN